MGSEVVRISRINDLGKDTDSLLRRSKRMRRTGDDSEYFLATAMPQEAEMVTGGDDSTDLSSAPVNHAHDLRDVDLITVSWESFHLSTPSTAHDFSPEEHIPHHEEEKVRLANMNDDHVKHEEHIQHYEGEKVRLANINDICVKAKADFEALQQRSHSLGEEASRLKVMLQKVEEQITSCRLESKEMETRLGEIKASVMEAEERVKIAAEKAGSANKT